MENAGVVEVAVYVEVARKKLFALLLIVHAKLPDEASVRASCGAVEEEAVTFHIGVVVPKPVPPWPHRICSIPLTMALMFPATPAANPVVADERSGRSVGTVTESAVPLLKRNPFAFGAKLFV